MPEDMPAFDPGVVPPNWGANVQAPPPPAVDALVPPELPVQGGIIEVEEVVPAEPVHKYRAVRGGGDQIFIIKDGKRHWVLNANIYEKLGYKFGDEDRVEQSEIATYLPGETITLVNLENFK